VSNLSRIPWIYYRTHLYCLACTRALGREHCVCLHMAYIITENSIKDGHTASPISATRECTNVERGLTVWIAHRKGSSTHWLTKWSIYRRATNTEFVSLLWWGLGLQVPSLWIDRWFPCVYSEIPRAHWTSCFLFHVARWRPRSWSLLYLGRGRRWHAGKGCQKDAQWIKNPKTHWIFPEVLQIKLAYIIN